MNKKNDLRKIQIKNRLYHYFDDMINGTKINFSNILLNEKIYENISVYIISYNSPTSPIPVHIRFHKID